MTPVNYPNSACEKHRNVTTSEPVCVACLFEKGERLSVEVDRLRRVLMNIESAKRLHSGIPWEAMVMTLQDIARNGLKP